MILLTIIALIFALITFLLITPLSIEVDSTIHRYEVRWFGIARCNLIFNEAGMLIRLNILGWRKEINPFAKTEKKALPAKVVRKKKSMKISFSKMWGKMLAELRSFRVKRLEVNIDTDDYLLNAYLFPVGELMSHKNRIWHINFENINLVKLKISNNGFRILLAVLK